MKSPFFFILMVVVCASGPTLAPAAEWTSLHLGQAPASAQPGTGEWYRCYIRVPENMVTPQEKDLWRDSVTLTMRSMATPFTVWLNGQRIIESQSILAGKAARFKVPKGILEKEKFNALVIEIQGKADGKSFVESPILSGYFDEAVLGPEWQFSANEPLAEELKAVSKNPITATYTEKAFQLATTPMEVAPELIRGKFVSPAEALAALKTDDDLVVEEMLHEPEIAQPTHVSFDERGRAWVSQYRQYPYPAGLKMTRRDQFYRSQYDKVPPPPPHQDKGADIISVHEDTDGDGRYDKHTNVLSGLNMANAAVKGYGGLWVMNTPYLLFYPDANGDDIPDGEPEVRLAGFGLEDTHSVANGLIWGPDGWLYGAQGSTTTSRVVRPGLDPEGFTGLYNEGCMVWRYHPTLKKYEIFADGSGNTFGLSFDSEGRLYSGHNGGDTRGWHHVQSGLYLKQGKDPGKFGPAPNPYAFGEMPMMKSTNSVPRFSHMLCMVEGSAMPARWKDHFFAIDPLHHHVVAAKRQSQGSTFQTSDIGFPLHSQDETFRPVFIVNAPDGSIMVADFREEYIAHGQNYQSQIDPATGRLYRLRGKDRRLEMDLNLAAKSSVQLVELLSHPNLWHRQTAVRLLRERKEKSVVESLRKLVTQPLDHPALEALWALHGIAGLSEASALSLLDHPSAVVRAWTLRLAGDEGKLQELLLTRAMKMAREDTSAEVRCQISSTARRLPADQALPLIWALATRGEDAADPFIPLMLWFCLESHCKLNSELILQGCADKSLWQAPLFRAALAGKLMRRFAEAGTQEDLLIAARLLTIAPDDEAKKLLIAGFEEAFKSRALPSLPTELAKALSESGMVSPMLRLRQGDATAIASALKIVLDQAAPEIERISFIRALGEIKQPQAIDPLLITATTAAFPEVAKTALGALSQFEAQDISKTVLTKWPTLAPEVKAAALNLLVSRPTWCLDLVMAVKSGVVEKGLLNPDLVTRLTSHHGPRELSSLSAELFAKAAAQPRESLKPRIDQVKNVLQKQAGNAYRGESHFMALCASCHTLFFKGGKIGPNLTTYQRDDLGTMLISIIDPNAEVREGFANYLITTKDGRVLSGFLAEKTSQSVVLRGFDGVDVTLALTEITQMQPVGRSLMPEGLLDQLNDEQMRDLFAYLQQSQPITK